MSNEGPRCPSGRRIYTRDAATKALAAIKSADTGYKSTPYAHPCLICREIHIVFRKF